MKKNKKKIIASLVCTFAIFSVTNVFANIYWTNLHISTGATLVGQKYSLDNPNQKVTFWWTTIGKVNASNPGMNVTAKKKALVSYKEYRSDYLVVPVGTPSSELNYNNAGSGSYQWVFNTGNSANPTGYFDADQVAIRSLP